jgi:tetratricopeptide (TPR) repeat protein
VTVSKLQNAYAILGLTKSASPDEIKQAYVQLVKKYDPEKHTDHFMVVQNAFDKLRDPMRRAQEDVITFNYIPGDFLFNEDEKASASDVQVIQALQMIEKKKAEGSIDPADADRKFVQAHMILSWKKVQKKLWIEAIQEWKAVLAVNSSHRRAKNNLLHSLITLGHSYALHELFEEAVEVWTQAIQMNPDDVALLHNLALACELGGNTPDAARYWRETITRWKVQLQREPDNDHLKNSLIEALRSHGEYDPRQLAPTAPASGRNAQPEAFRRGVPGAPGAPAAPAAPGAPGAPSSRGAPSAPSHPQGLSLRDRPLKSIDDYREIVRLNADDFEAHYQVANLLMKERKWHEAIEQLNLMREKWARNVEILNLLGWALLNGGKVDDAFVMWRKARSIEPRNLQITESLIKAHMTMGRTLRDRGLFTPCLVHFKALMRYLPDNDEVFYEIALTYQKKGDERSAQQEYNKVLKINPKHKGARNGLASLKLRR